MTFQQKLMRPAIRPLTAIIVLAVVSTLAALAEPRADLEMVARIREEGFQRSQAMDILGYMTDVLGARLTLSQDMKRAQAWAEEKMKQIGLENVAIEPFMDYGVTWDNEYVSLHMLEPDYRPITGYPLSHTPSTAGKLVLPVVAAEVRTKKDLDQYKGKLKGAAVLSTPPAVIDLDALAQGTPRRSADDLKQLEQAVIPKPQRRPPPPTPANPDLLKPEEIAAFYKSEDAAAILQTGGGRIGSVPGFARPGTKTDKWSREKSLESLPILAITPEHYNRMHRIVKRGIPVKVEIEVRNRIGEKVEQAANVIGEIPGTDLKEEIVMIGAHFDTWHASPNASDDTAGCAVALEAARILKAVGARPRRTIRVAFWNGEEQGINGSREYVLKHFGDPKDPKIGVKPAYEKFSVYFNQDYGAGAFRGIYLQGNEHVRRYFAAWMEPLRDLGFTAISIQSVGSTDHVPFENAGLPGFQFIQDRIPGTAGHTNLDFLDTIPPDDVMKNAVIMATFAWHAAMSDERMPRKTLPLKAQESETK